jgi:hypothetical protein
MSVAVGVHGPKTMLGFPSDVCGVCDGTGWSAEIVYADKAIVAPTVIIPATCLSLQSPRY